MLSYKCVVVLVCACTMLGVSLRTLAMAFRKKVFLTCGLHLALNALPSNSSTTVSRETRVHIQDIATTASRDLLAAGVVCGQHVVESLAAAAVELREGHCNQTNIQCTPLYTYMYISLSELGRESDTRHVTSNT
jgi:hypothetical protein